MTDPKEEREHRVMSYEIVRPAGNPMSHRRGDEVPAAPLGGRRTFENAPETLGPCVHCGRGMAEHRQDRDDPTAFLCPNERTPVSISDERKAPRINDEKLARLTFSSAPLTDVTIGNLMLDLMDARSALARVTGERDAARAEGQRRVMVNKWGIQLVDALGKFVAQCLEAEHPLTTNILCEFPDMPAKPILRLWATTDDQSPVTRIAKVVAERDAARDERDRLRETVAKLPLTADGVPIVLGENLWAVVTVNVNPPVRTIIPCGFIFWSMDGGGYVRDVNGDEYSVDFDDCYSTKEAAESALAARGAGDGRGEGEGQK